MAALKITRKDIENEAVRIVAKQRKVSPESSTTTCNTTTTTITISEPIDIPVKVSFGLNLLACVTANPYHVITSDDIIQGDCCILQCHRLYDFFEHTASLSAQVDVIFPQHVFLLSCTACG